MTTGTYLLWRRHVVLLKLGGILLAIVVIVRVLTALLVPAYLVTSVVASAAAAGVMAWFGVRSLRQPVGVRVSSEGLTLTPTDGSRALTWRWGELELSLHADDEDGTLQIRSPAGTFLLARSSSSEMRTLLDAIARRGGPVL